MPESPARRVIEPAVDADLERDRREIDITRERERAGQVLRAGDFVLIVANREVSDLQCAGVDESRRRRDQTRVQRVAGGNDLERRTGRIESRRAAIEQR